MSDALKTVTITGVEIVKTGNTNGRDWTIRRVKANDQHGRPINEKLTTFSDLKEGATYQVEVEKKTHPEYGDEFILKLPKGAGGAAAAELRPRIEKLESVVDGLRADVLDLTKQLAALSQPAPAAAAQAAAPVGLPARAGIADDDDIPF